MMMITCLIGPAVAASLAWDPPRPGSAAYAFGAIRERIAALTTVRSRNCLVSCFSMEHSKDNNPGKGLRDRSAHMLGRSHDRYAAIECHLQKQSETVAEA